MKNMQRYLLPVTVLAVLLALSLSVWAEVPAAPEEITPTPLPPIQPQLGEETDTLLAAIEDAIATENEDSLAYMLHDEEVEDLEISSDGNHAIAWLVFKDPESGEILPTEPGLVLARKDPLTGWRVSLPSDADWLEQLESAPIELVSVELEQTWLEMYADQVEQLDIGPLPGYLLPWAAGQVAWLSQSVAHDKYIPSGSAHYSFDFYIPQTMFNLYASKSGIVWRARWQVANDNHDGVGNYLVLQDTSTSPTTYQLYLHLAQDSIPPQLRVRGAPVVQGQFIGIADNTGQSSGHHLHYQVHTNPDSYWGTSVDITFADVPINGGRPRVHNSFYSDLPYCRQDGTYNDVCEQFQNTYVSGNIVKGDITPPYGQITAPVIGANLAASSVQINGWAKDDDSGVDKVQIIANYQGVWFDVGGPFSTPSFSTSWDMCSQNLPNGPVSLALRIWDKQGNMTLGLPGLTHFTKNYTCPPPPPACTPTQDQVALFADPNFKGACVVLGAGDYASSSLLSPLGDDNAESVKIGENVLATIYTDANYGGRGETFGANDSNLKDNLIGSNLLTSLKVLARTATPAATAKLIAPEEGASLDLSPSLSLSWRAPPGGLEFQGKLQGPSGTTISDWLPEPVWHLDQLVLNPGAYSWQVRARNGSAEGAWSATSPFTITNTSLPTHTSTAPLINNFEGGASDWTATGLWNFIDDDQRSHDGSDHSWYYGSSNSNYKDGSPNTGDLTSPEILVPNANPNYSLRFWYRYKTENSEKHRDQRWVQISENGGPFKNILQLYDDPENFWLSPTIDLSAYVGSKIRIRFHFETLDGAFNEFEGWYIDDVEITTTALEGCGDADYTTAQATELKYGDKLDQSICPSGDIDYFKFTASAGDRIAVDIDTSTNDPPADLDYYLFLLDQDGRSVLAEHDDEVLGVRRDPHLGYLFDRSGTYYLKVRSWAHPSAGGSEYTYALHMIKDNTPPSASFTYPLSGSLLPDGKIVLKIKASDGASGLSHVDFLWHSGDWLHDTWTSIGSDWDGSDGWSLSFDTSGLPQQGEVAFYANVYDWAGNWTGVGAWRMGIKLSPLYLPMINR